ncbi:hypothetical protein, partial [Sphingomonas sp.]|uniref:hypothetical protein n=1 Tax=Sphingomonas sp. TaxID=28214 RepID=UPI00286C2179
RRPPPAHGSAAQIGIEERAGRIDDDVSERSRVGKCFIHETRMSAIGGEQTFIRRQKSRLLPFVNQAYMGPSPL